MANTINLQTVMNSLHNLMGHRVAPGGTDEDLVRYVQASFDYAWRYYRWGFSMGTAVIAADGVLPVDIDIDGYRVFDGVSESDIIDTLAAGGGGSAVVFDQTTGRFVLSPVASGSVVYQKTPPTLATDVNVPFQSSQIIALGASVYAKQGENPTRADIQQEWDLFHSELDRLVANADRGRIRRPRNFHDVNGGGTGFVG